MFKLKSKYAPTWDQPRAIEAMLKYIKAWYKNQTLWWVTWSGKTFTMANIIQEIQKPTLIIAHNKTLAAQLAGEFKEFFPDNEVHYFVSYYDYYQPEAYVSKTDTYIEKEATINAEIDRLRHAATQSLLWRKDVIIVASVSCIYWVWDIQAYRESVFDLKVWDEYHFDNLIKKLLLLQYKRAGADFTPGTFQIMWDLIEIYPSSMETIYSLEFWWNELSSIKRRNYLTWEIYEHLDKIEIFPAKHTVTTKDTIEKIIPEIKKELEERLAYFKEIWDVLRYERLKTKVEYDIEMMQEVGYVNGIENYSRYLDWRWAWAPPATLIDYFGDDFLCFVDESHMTISQIWGMYAWDRARKVNLVENGFRLPSAMDNRPLQFDEFEGKMKQMVLVSATPWDYDIKTTCKNPDKYFNFNPLTDWLWQDSEDYRVVPLLIRPTGLLDPKIELRSMEYMVDDVMKNIKEVVDLWEKMLITTITKRSSEELCDYLLENGIKVKYLHSEIETLERLDILKDLRTWVIDVIVWVNLLREWLDLPEVTKIAIIDADKQWFLRSTSSLIQIIWRAARNAKWTVYMYVEQNLKMSDFFKEDRVPVDYLIDEFKNKIELFEFNKWKFLTREWYFISNAMKQAINLTNYRRWLQIESNLKNNITPTTIISGIKDMWIKTKWVDYALIDEETLDKKIKLLEFEMNIASVNMDFEKAAELRDEIISLKGKR